MDQFITVRGMLEPQPPGDPFSLTAIDGDANFDGDRVPGGHNSTDAVAQRADIRLGHGIVQTAARQGRIFALRSPGSREWTSQPYNTTADDPVTT